MIIRFSHATPRQWSAARLSALLLLSLTSGHAQNSDPASTPALAPVGRKNRIVFDYPASSPTASPSPSPSPAVSPQAAERVKALLAPEEPAPTPSPSPASGRPSFVPPPPQSTPVSYAAPVQPLALPEPTATPEAAPEATPVATPVVAEVPPAPQPNAEPDESPVTAARETEAAPADSSAPPLAAVPAPSAEPVAEPPKAPAETPSPLAMTPGEDEAQNAAAESAQLPTPDGIDVVANAATPDLAPLEGVGESVPPPPSESVTINLINKLVQRGILTKEDAKDMVTQAQAEADAVRTQMQADMFAVAQVAAARAAADQIAIAQAGALPAPTEDDVRVTYIPDPVKTQIKEEIKMELNSEVKRGTFAIGPVARVPEWVSRVRPFMDLRLRYEGVFFPQGNDATGAFPNFNAINTGAPFDVTGNEFAPQFNVDQNRNRFRIRVRAGAEFDLTRNFTMGLRIATGENNSPVTTNQTIGLANQGQGGNFSRYAIWLDRAFLRYQAGIGEGEAALWVGRFDNPFFSTPLIFDDDLGFDGVALQLKYPFFDGAVTPFITAGAFPVFNTDFNFSSNQPQKFASYDKYLFGGQVGVNVNPARDWNIKLAAAYYYFQNIEGKLSSPFTPQSPDDAGDTDNSRPSFAQKGNTYFPIRNIVPDASNDYGAINQWQYYGLATKFQELAITGRIDYDGFEPVQVSLIGEFVQNLAFNESDINAIAVNNRGAIDPNDIDDILGDFEGSPVGWLVEARVGTPSLAKAWDWGITFGYRWIGSDSVVDGFNESDFGLGGTNMKGFTAGGALALSPNVWFGVRWMGADSLAGPQFKVNIFQFDLHSKF